MTSHNNNNKFSHSINYAPQNDDNIDSQHNVKYISVFFTESITVGNKTINTVSISEQLTDEDSAISFAENLSKDLIGVNLDLCEVTYKNIGTFYSYVEEDKKYKIVIRY